ncbi:WD repeat and HMG-box DNA binding-domain containing protein 1 [Pleodorina starrii]|nr:WD repeat and HMG-box DNA binding-domain containing protein 1 [Pleodorina starrii]
MAPLTISDPQDCATASLQVGVLKTLEAANGQGDAVWLARIEYPGGRLLNELLQFVVICQEAFVQTVPPFLHVRCLTPEAVRDKQVIVVGDGSDAWDAACAIALLNGARGLQLMPSAPALHTAAASAPQQEAGQGTPTTPTTTTAAGTTAGTTTAAAAANVAFTSAPAAAPTTTFLPGSALLDEARRRALQAALQPHYTAPAPGAVSLVLRAPTKRRFWAYVRGKAERAVRRTESGVAEGVSGAESPVLSPAVAVAAPDLPTCPVAGPGSADSPVLVWAPSLSDPRVMPFLSRQLREALLAGGGLGPGQEAAGRRSSSGGGGGGNSGGNSGGGGGAAGGAGRVGWWEGPSLVLYRGMIHPDIAGLLFLGLETHPSSSPLVSQLQAQWLVAHVRNQLQLPPPADMRADIARQRAWRSAALAHPLMSTHGSLARAQERHYLLQLNADLGAIGAANGGSLKGASGLGMTAPPGTVQQQQQQQQQQQLGLVTAVEGRPAGVAPPGAEHSSPSDLPQRRSRTSLLRRYLGAVMAAEGGAPGRVSADGGARNTSSSCNGSVLSLRSTQPSGALNDLTGADTAAAAAAAVEDSVDSPGEAGGHRFRRSSMPGFRAVRQALTDLKTTSRLSLLRRLSAGGGDCLSATGVASEPSPPTPPSSFKFTNRRAAAVAPVDHNPAAAAGSPPPLQPPPAAGYATAAAAGPSTPCKVVPMWSSGGSPAPRHPDAAVSTHAAAVVVAGAGGAGGACIGPGKAPPSLGAAPTSAPDGGGPSCRLDIAGSGGIDQGREAQQQQQQQQLSRHVAAPQAMLLLASRDQEEDAAPDPRVGGAVAAHLSTAADDSLAAAPLGVGLGRGASRGALRITQTGESMAVDRATTMTTLASTSGDVRGAVLQLFAEDDDGGGSAADDEKEEGGSPRELATPAAREAGIACAGISDDDDGAGGGGGGGGGGAGGGGGGDAQADMDGRSRVTAPVREDTAIATATAGGAPSVGAPPTPSHEDAKRPPGSALVVAPMAEHAAVGVGVVVAQRRRSVEFPPASAAEVAAAEVAEAAVMAPVTAPEAAVAEAAAPVAAATPLPAAAAVSPSRTPSSQSLPLRPQVSHHGRLLASHTPPPLPVVREACESACQSLDAPSLNGLTQKEDGEKSHREEEAEDGSSGRNVCDTSAAAIPQLGLLNDGDGEGYGEGGRNSEDEHLREAVRHGAWRLDPRSVPLPQLQIPVGYGFGAGACRGGGGGGGGGGVLGGSVDAGWGQPSQPLPPTMAAPTSSNPPGTRPTTTATIAAATAATILPQSQAHSALYNSTPLPLLHAGRFLLSGSGVVPEEVDEASPWIQVGDGDGDGSNSPGEGEAAEDGGWDADHLAASATAVARASSAAGREAPAAGQQQRVSGALDRPTGQQPAATRPGRQAPPPGTSTSSRGLRGSKSDVLTRSGASVSSTSPPLGEAGVRGQVGGANSATRTAAAAAAAAGQPEGGAVDVMRSQIAALRAHLLNPGSNPFPDIIGGGGASGAGAGAGTLTGRNSNLQATAHGRVPGASGISLQLPNVRAAMLRVGGGGGGGGGRRTGGGGGGTASPPLQSVLSTSTAAATPRAIGRRSVAATLAAHLGLGPKAQPRGTGGGGGGGGPQMSQSQPSAAAGAPAAADGRSSAAVALVTAQSDGTGDGEGSRSAAGWFPTLGISLGVSLSPPPPPPGGFTKGSTGASFQRSSVPTPSTSPDGGRRSPVTPLANTSVPPLAIPDAAATAAAAGSTAVASTRTVGTELPAASAASPGSAASPPALTATSAGVAATATTAPPTAYPGGAALRSQRQLQQPQTAAAQGFERQSTAQTSTAATTAAITSPTKSAAEGISRSPSPSPRPSPGASPSPKRAGAETGAAAVSRPAVSAGGRTTNVRRSLVLDFFIRGAGGGSIKSRVPEEGPEATDGVSEPCEPGAAAATAVFQAGGDCGAAADGFNRRRISIGDGGRDCSTGSTDCTSPVNGPFSLPLRKLQLPYFELGGGSLFARSSGGSGGDGGGGSTGGAEPDGGTGQRTRSRLGSSLLAAAGASPASGSTCPASVLQALRVRRGSTAGDSGRGGDQLGSLLGRAADAATVPYSKSSQLAKLTLNRGAVPGIGGGGGGIGGGGGGNLCDDDAGLAAALGVHVGGSDTTSDDEGDDDGGGGGEGGYAGGGIRGGAGGGGVAGGPSLGTLLEANVTVTGSISARPNAMIATAAVADDAGGPATPRHPLPGPGCGISIGPTFTADSATTTTATSITAAANTARTVALACATTQQPQSHEQQQQQQPPWAQHVPDLALSLQLPRSETQMHLPISPPLSTGISVSGGGAPLRRRSAEPLLLHPGGGAAAAAAPPPPSFPSVSPRLRPSPSLSPSASRQPSPLTRSSTLLSLKGSGRHLPVMPEQLVEAEVEARTEAMAMPGRRSPAWVVRRISEAKQERLVSEVSAWLKDALQRGSRRPSAPGGLIQMKE